MIKFKLNFLLYCLIYEQGFAKNILNSLPQPANLHQDDEILHNKKLNQIISLDCDKLFNLHSLYRSNLLNETLLKFYEDECFDNYLLSSPRINVYAFFGDNATCECHLGKKTHSIFKKLGSLVKIFQDIIPNFDKKNITNLINNFETRNVSNNSTFYYNGNINNLTNLNLLNNGIKVKWKFLDKSIKSRLVFLEEGTKMTIKKAKLEDSGKYLCFRQQDFDMDGYQEKLLISTCVLHVEHVPSTGNLNRKIQIVYIILGSIFPSVLLFSFLVMAYYAHRQYKKPNAKRNDRVYLYSMIHDNVLNY
ncbi:unnamed protein product [Gordionus sp. m RMFG-2023]|uniref:uncharacterized protein LOC135926328 n=1 Tax=Gordionus sp. m RMFG-2023 TaxID=3053472 RepID=UPI0030E44FCF